MIKPAKIIKQTANSILKNKFYFEKQKTLKLKSKPVLKLQPIVMSL
jgi:hypothetical protein